MPQELLLAALYAAYAAVVANTISAATSRERRRLHNHGLTIVTVCLLTAWIVLYSLSDPNKHLGSFFGNAIADWSGSVLMILGTKYLYERGSAESRDCPDDKPGRLRQLLRDHSLGIFIIVTGIGWAIAYARMDPNSRWGQVVGNIVSEWTQAFGMVFLTKKLIEVGSKESKE